MQQQTYTTRISNRQVSATLIGLAYDNDTDEIFYASVIGPQASLKSIWATLVARKAQIRVSGQYRHGRHGHYVFPYIWSGRGAKGLKSFWSPLPGTAWQHMIAVSRDVLEGDIVLVTHPDGVYKTGDERKALRDQAEEEFLRRFVAAVNARTQVPVLPEWGRAVFSHAMQLPRDKAWSEKLSAYGDAIVAYRTNATTASVLAAVRADVLGKEVAQ